MISEIKNGPDLRYKNIKDYIEGSSQSKARINIVTLYSENSTVWNTGIKIISYMLPDKLLSYFKHILSQMKIINRQPLLR